MRPPDRVAGTGVVLRRMTAGDAPDIAAAVIESGESLSRYESWARPGFTTADAFSYVVWWARAWEEGTAFYYAVEDETGRLCGSCGLGQVDVERRTAAIGYWIRSSAAGNGLATAAVRAIIEAAWSCGFEGLTIVAAESNVPSRRVAEKAGGIESPDDVGTVYEDGSQVRAVQYVIVG
ncbi:MAG TPA: GNAT family N-acetyltransferase [Acidimicrobiia bacterium]|nr:GNAT family N-acetyltransferase [Acidimicrobiia bacterium]